MANKIYNYTIVYFYFQLLYRHRMPPNYSLDSHSLNTYCSSTDIVTARHSMRCLIAYGYEWNIQVKNDKHKCVNFPTRRPAGNLFDCCFLTEQDQSGKINDQHPKWSWDVEISLVWYSLVIFEKRNDYDDVDDDDDETYAHIMNE